MRVSTFHRHTVQRSSPLLSGVLTAHFLYSLLFAVPVLVAGFTQYFAADNSRPWNAKWAGFILFFWIAVEAPRYYFGFAMNRGGEVVYGVAFIALCVVPQLVLIILYFAKVGYSSELEFGVCILQMLLLLLEVVLSAKLTVRLGLHDTINFYVRLGAIQRQAVAEEMKPLTGGEGSALRAGGSVSLGSVSRWGATRSNPQGGTRQSMMLGWTMPGTRTPTRLGFVP